ncbi:hypothetical protein N1028_03900 [Herbiconiux sp. CPCC 203407]|uniref:Uncharacterized protein n=1 Tax=Herbiconiux oxytropis TaxID=2970915 RepID=A0AA42BSR0_9MICO|nr:hypothetical protein [Herbiconiux oxytropis]MCS5720641.1 hypothetical protein [Herbiconiux oxytropis]MCS5725032.1 hypothetical protein [Herbiconiux oxytropis]
MASTLAALTAAALLGVVLMVNPGGTGQRDRTASAEPAGPADAVDAAELESVEPPDTSELAEEYLTPEEAPGAWSSDTSAFPEPLPRGRSWPEVPPSVLTTEGEVSEDGLSQVMAAYHWMCAWEDEAVTAAAGKDPARAAEAVAQLEKFTGLPGIVDNLQNSDSWVEHVLVPAREGEFVEMEDEFEGPTCDGYRETEASR